MYRQSEKLVKQQYLLYMSPHYGDFGPLAAEIVSLVWGTRVNFDGFCVLVALLHGTIVVGVSQTLRRWTDGATYIRQGGHHVGHWPTFLVFNNLHATLTTFCLKKKADKIKKNVFECACYNNVVTDLNTISTFNTNVPSLCHRHCPN